MKPFTVGLGAHPPFFPSTPSFPSTPPPRPHIFPYSWAIPKLQLLITPSKKMVLYMGYSTALLAGDEWHPPSKPFNTNSSNCGIDTGIVNKWFSVLTVTGKEPGRACLALMRAYAYIQAGNPEQACKVM